MKKRTASLILVLVLAFCFSACGRENGMTAADDERIRVVATIFPEYDWVMNILGENPANVEVTMLMDKGVDLHSYQPTADDILKISDCDLFIYVGGESDAWVNDALKEAANKEKVVIDLLDELGDLAREEEVVEGMQEEEGREEADAAEEEPEYDEHVWLSLRNAGAFVQRISEAFQDLDPDHAAIYQNNAASYLDRLKALDKEYEAAVQNAAFHTLLFGDRFPFRYLVDDYGLDYYAAFVGCSAETEASFETITFLAQKLDELGIPAILTIEGSDQRIAKTIVQVTETKDQKILTLDSLQSTTSEDVKNGASYLSAMEKNLSVLEEALNG